MTGKILPDQKQHEDQLLDATREVIQGSKPHVYWNNGNLVVNVNILTLKGEVVHGHCLFGETDLRYAKDLPLFMRIRVDVMRRRVAEELTKHGERLDKALFIDNEMYKRLISVRRKEVPDGPAT